MTSFVVKYAVAVAELRDVVFGSPKYTHCNIDTKDEAHAGLYPRAGSRAILIEALLFFSFCKHLRQQIGKIYCVFMRAAPGNPVQMIPRMLSGTKKEEPLSCAMLRNTTLKKNDVRHVTVKMALDCNGFSFPLVCRLK